MLPVEQALAQLLANAPRLTETEELPLSQVLGRVLAQDQVSNLEVPPADNSAMDGYALNTADLKASQGSLPLSQRIPAGVVPEPLQAGTAARIFTGASVPAGADAVVMQEQCSEAEGRVSIQAEVKPGQNIRPRGQDITAGAVVLSRGHCLRPQDLGLLASIGVAQVRVYRRLKVAIFSTGDELTEPGQPLDEGQIYNSNRYTLIGLLNALGFEYVDLGPVKDTPEATETALKEAAGLADVILSTGGVSVGEEDHVKAAVEKLGELTLWRLAIKPGKPLAYGRVGSTPFIGLPGNPAAVFITFCVIARPWLLRMQGASEVEVKPVQVAAGFATRRVAKRKEFYRCRLELDERGISRAVPYSNQSSGVLTSTSWADGLAVVPVGQPIVEDDPIDFLPLSALLSQSRL